MRTALIVEDDFALQIIYDRILKDSGYSITQVTTGTDAISALSEGFIPDVMFLDMLLPEKNGVAVIEFIKENPHLHQIKVFLVSSNANFQRYVNEIPNAEFVLKPIRPQQIRDLIS